MMVQIVYYCAEPDVSVPSADGFGARDQDLDFHKQVEARFLDFL